MRLAGAILVFAMVALAILGPRYTVDPLAQDIDHGLSKTGAPLAPSCGHWLGTDELGRDELARVVDGAGHSLGVGALATLLALGIGVAVGVAAGMSGGRVDEVLMRGVDLVLAFPFLLLAILLAALLRDSDWAGSSGPVVVALGVSGWPATARIVRAKAMALARGEVALASRAMGGSPWWVARKHVLPGAMGVVTATAALAFAQNLLAEAALAFLGLGPPPPAATWGRMLFDGRVFYTSAPWLIAAPGLAIAISAMGFFLLAEGLRK